MLDEARRIIAELEPHADRMKPGDKRFYESWQTYLMRVGNDARLNERRLCWLRRLRDDYSATPAQQRAA